MRMKRLVSLGLAALAVVGIALFQQADVGAASLTTTGKVLITGTLTNVTGLSTATAPVNVTQSVALANGVAASQADEIYTASLSIASGGTQSIDVQGSLTDAFGAAFTPAKLKVVYVASDSSNTTNLTLFGDTNSVPILNTAATTTTLDPGGVFYVARPTLAGIAVTAGTGDIIKIVNAAGATATVYVVLVGTSS